jgi:hypothetical protein
MERITLVVEVVHGKELEQIFHREELVVEVQVVQVVV